MTKEEKYEVVKQLTETLSKTPNVYVTEAGGLTVGQVNELRGLCHEVGVEMRVVKNTLLKKAMEAAEGNYEELYPALKEQSSVFFVGENFNQPAKVLLKFRKKNPKPVLKAAYVGEAVFMGDDSLDSLGALKSKNELIADLVALLQSPMKNVLGQLNSGANTITGVLKTLAERSEG